MKRIKFPFKCPCAEEFQVGSDKPRLLGFTMCHGTCPHCDTRYEIALRMNRKGKKTDVEMKVVKTYVGEKLAQLIRKRSLEKDEAWKERLPKMK